MESVNQISANNEQTNHKKSITILIFVVLLSNLTILLRENNLTYVLEREQRLSWSLYLELFKVFCPF
jgi:hypothetical protein